jgi:apolipoprotein N-acyltransferase
MFPPFPKFFHRQPVAGETDLPFVEQVRIAQAPEPRSRRSEVILIGGWALVILKCALVWWLCNTYSVPIHPGWVIVPTLLGAALCTALYWRRF